MQLQRKTLGLLEGNRQQQQPTTRVTCLSSSILRRDRERREKETFMRGFSKNDPHALSRQKIKDTVIGIRHRELTSMRLLRTVSYHIVRSKTWSPTPSPASVALP